MKNTSSSNISTNFKKIFNKFKKDLNSQKNTINILNKNFKLNFQTKELIRFQNFKTIALVGMGGSILGAAAINNFLQKKISKKIYFFDNLDENKISEFKKKEKTSKVLFLIISKSGNTVETLFNAFSLKVLNKNAKNVIIISEENNNLLYNISKKLNLFHIKHRNYVGGRYSVLSEVGLIPAHLMGVNITKLRSEIRDCLKEKNISFLRNSSIKFAKLLRTKKFNNLILLNYCPELEHFLYWCQQLIAESLGKKGKGFLPVVSNVPKDHHSLLQLYLDGPKDKFFYIFSSDQKLSSTINIKTKIFGKNILHKKKLSAVKYAQREALIKAFKKNKTPFREFKIKEFNEKNLGKLFSHFMVEIILIGKLLKINPFDQPAVEEIKIYTKENLNKKLQK